MDTNNKKSSPYVYSTNPDFKPPVSEEEEALENVLAAKQKIKVALQTKNRGGKAITLITGFRGSEEEEENLGKKLKAYCGTGGAVKDGEIIVQGDSRDKVLQWLHKNGYVAARKI